MNNNCENFLEAPIKGGMELLKPYIKHTHKGKKQYAFLDFEKIIPQPPEQRGNDFTLYGWNIHNWGTGGNSYNGVESEKGIRFFSLWLPPLPVIKTLAIKLSTMLSMMYNIFDINTCGHFIALPDGSVDELCYSYQDAPKKLRRTLNIPSNIEVDK